MTKLGHIPHQKNMSDEQEQTFTNGINKGRKLERKAHEKSPLRQKDIRTGAQQERYRILGILKRYEDMPTWRFEELYAEINGETE